MISPASIGLGVLLHADDADDADDDAARIRVHLSNIPVSIV